LPITIPVIKLQYIPLGAILDFHASDLQRRRKWVCCGASHPRGCISRVITHHQWHDRIGLSHANYGNYQSNQKKRHPLFANHNYFSRCRKPACLQLLIIKKAEPALSAWLAVPGAKQKPGPFKAARLSSLTAVICRSLLADDEPAKFKAITAYKPNFFNNKIRGYFILFLIGLMIINNSILLIPNIFPLLVRLAQLILTPP
jgi:hypothetical protein